MSIHSTDRRVPMQKSFRNRRSWADTQGFRTGVFGETVDGVLIRESNRATVYEESKSGITVLRRILYENYLSKGVKAVLFGVPMGSPDSQRYHYAVFVQSNFLVHVEEEE